MTDTIARAAILVIEGGRVLLMKRYIRKPSAAVCPRCDHLGLEGPDCPGHHYAIIPGGHVEEGETYEAAALRELAEETTLTARIDRLLWTGNHFSRPARYFLATDVVGVPTLSGEEAGANGPTNSYALCWAGAEDLADLNLLPEEARDPLRRFLRGDRDDQGDNVVCEQDQATIFP